MTQKNYSDTKHWLRTAKTITEALPYMRRYAGKTFVIKYGGHAMGNAELAEIFARDIVLMKQVGIHPVVVHGGGPQIGAMLERLAVKSEFIDGLRITDAETVSIVEMVLSGTINKQIVSAINKAGGTAIGISGKDGDLIKASKLRRTRRDKDSNIEKILDLGYVGEPREVNPQILTSLEQSGMIPVIAPIGIGAGGETYNINADTVAGAVAAAIGATRRRPADRFGQPPGARPDGGRHRHRRHDPEAGDLPRRLGDGRRSDRHSGRPRAPRAAARDLYRTRRRHPDQRQVSAGGTPGRAL